MIRIYLVTFQSTGTQFVCETKNKKLALEKAMKANNEMGYVDGVNNKKEYTVELINWPLLKEILKRADYYGVMNDCVIFD